jgi:hypothetical protein
MWFVSDEGIQQPRSGRWIGQLARDGELIWVDIPVS